MNMKKTAIREWTLPSLRRKFIISRTDTHFLCGEMGDCKYWRQVRHCAGARSDRGAACRKNPGNAGQMYLPYVGKKITKLLSMKEDMNFEIYWDGACSADKIREFAPKGVRGFVLGTTLLFGKEQTYGETLRNIRELRL